MGAASSLSSVTATSFYKRVSSILSQHLQRESRIVVALSGGVDSVVLLDVLRRWSARKKIELRAVHINHQISPNAGIWAHFCRALCREWEIPLQVVKVTVEHGNSTEAAAREERYKVFLRQRADYIALAHHLDDQGETLLLQLLRGAGIAGLSAMPVVRNTSAKMPASRDERHESTLLRPLLDISRAEIAAYARRRKLRWVEDESNADIGYDRNFLRHEVLPLIAQRYPGYRATLARASRHFAEATQLLDVLAAQDLPEDARNNGIPLETLQALGAVRAKNALRFYFRNAGIDAPSAAQLEECMRQALTAHADSEMLMVFGDYELRCFARRLYLVTKMPVLPMNYVQAWRGEDPWNLPELGGQFVFSRSKGFGISLAKLRNESVTVRLRVGGERFQPDSKRPRRSLKHWLQEARIPPWQRARLPLLYCKEHLIYVPGIGIDSLFQAQAHEESIAPQWNS